MALAMTMTGFVFNLVNFKLIYIILRICCFRYRDPEVYRQTKTILLEAGQFFQAQDDFLGTKILIFLIVIIQIFS